jgi:oxygen-independent coproporphyrinogen-3 oxidase
MFAGFGLYVHVPYCLIKCPYCDFNVRAGRSWPESRYVEALLAEIAHAGRIAPFGGRRLETIFIGGGTPSLFSPASVERLLAAARAAFAAADFVEISLETTPESLRSASLTGFREAGVNRLSIGIESYRGPLLKRLGRLQSETQTNNAVSLARRSGFGNINVDLMFAIPGQTRADWRLDLEQAIEDGPEHVSAYNLTYEEGTPFFELRRSGKLTATDDDLEAAMFEDARERLALAGYIAYEVSNFARPSYEARHNLNYWRGGAYLGIGAGAHSHEPCGTRTRRWSNEKDPETYIARALADGVAVATEELLEARAAAGEFVFLHLRTREGLDERSFTARFGIDLEETFPETRRLLADGLLVRRAPDHIALSPRGLLIADTVFRSFV